MTRLFYLAIVCLLLTSCSKKDTHPNTVNINGTYYPTTKIGNQTWTTVNYNGSGGLERDSTMNNPVYGKFYNYNDVMAIKVPKGWRLPTKGDYVKLLNGQGIILQGRDFNSKDTLGFNLIAKTTWKFKSGNNQSGFNAVAAGWPVVGGPTDDRGLFAIFATSTLNDDGTDLISLIFHNVGADVFMSFESFLDIGGQQYANVRFVKDN